VNSFSGIQNRLRTSVSYNFHVMIAFSFAVNSFSSVTYFSAHEVAKQERPSQVVDDTEYLAGFVALDYHCHI